MKHPILENPEVIGCYNCAYKPPVILPKKWRLDEEIVGWVELEVDGRVIWSSTGKERGKKTLWWLEQKFSKYINRAECVLLIFNSPLHDETYEYNRMDGNWYLVKQGKGFA